MATSVETIRKITIQAEGKSSVDDMTSSLNKLSTAQDGVAKVTDDSAKKQLSAEQAYQRQTLSVVSGARETANYEKAVRTAQSALNQGIITQTEYAARVDLLKDKFNQASNWTKAFATVTSGVSGQLIALSAGAGPVGVFLSALGPWGLAAAIGIGAVSAAFQVATQRADDFADGARKLKENADTVGLTINQYKTLSAAGAKVGLDTEQVSGFIEKLTVNFDQLRQGSGPLFDQLLRLDSGLVRELASAKDTATQFDILSRAYAQASDQAQKNAIARAIGGRSGVPGGRLLDSVGQQGGLNAITTQAAAAGKAIDEGLTARIANLKIEIDETNKRAGKMVDVLYAEPVLEAQLRAAQYAERAAKAVVDMSNAQAPSWFTQFISGVASGVNYNGVQGAKSQLTTGMNAGFNMSWAKQFDALRPDTGGAASGASSGSPAPSPPPPAISNSAQLNLALMQKWTAVLGSAITPAEQFKQKQLEIAAAMEKGGVSAQVGARALDQFKDSQTQATIAVKEGFGVASQSELVDTKMISLKKAIADGQIRVGEETDKATQIILKEAKAQDEANQIRASSLPGLKQMELDAGNVSKAFDQFGTSTIPTMASGLADMQMGTVTLSAGFNSMAQSVGKSLLTMINQMLLAQTVGKGLQAVFGALGLGSPAAGVGGGNQGEAIWVPPISAGTGRVGGMVGSLPTTYVHPAYFDNAPHMRSGGMITDDGVPVVAHPGERILNAQDTAAYNRGGGNVTNNVIIQNQSGGQVQQTQKKNSSGGVDTAVMIRAAVVDTIAGGHADPAMQSRFGVTPTRRSR